MREERKKLEMLTDGKVSFSCVCNEDDDDDEKEKKGGKIQFLSIYPYP